VMTSFMCVGEGVSPPSHQNTQPENSSKMHDSSTESDARPPRNFFFFCLCDMRQPLCGGGGDAFDFFDYRFSLHSSSFAPYGPNQSVACDHGGGDE